MTIDSTMTTIPASACPETLRNQLAAAQMTPVTTRTMHAFFPAGFRSTLSSSAFDMKISVLQLLHLLLDKTTISPEKTLTFYTKVQVEIAKKAEQLLTMDLKEHIPIKEIAIQLNVSETSLKNYFRGVYGKNISDYLRDLRMEYAKKLLTETKLPISEIAYMTGYTKQGKFAEVFREKFQLKPLEFRRTYNLNKPITKE